MQSTRKENKVIIFVTAENRTLRKGDDLSVASVVNGEDLLLSVPAATRPYRDRSNPMAASS